MIGWGPCSSNFTFLSNTYPAFMNPPISATLNVKPKSIYLTWTGIWLDVHDGRNLPIFYDL